MSGDGAAKLPQGSSRTPENSARIIDGKACAAIVRESVRDGVKLLRARGAVPGLAVVLVGEDPASQVYVRNKDRAANEAGFEVTTLRLPASTSQAELERVVQELNADDAVHGILVQLPLPKGLDSARIVLAIDPRKDVDGLHPDNVAALAMGLPGHVPCTPAGCIELCDRHDVPLEGRRVVVLGRSLLVGKPVALLCLARNATVTIAHSRTRDLPRVVGEAEVLIAAVGVPHLVRGAWLREGAAVIDVGMNRLPDGKLVGDVAFDEALSRASAITPVPGGVGPMTIAMLLKNTAAACAMQTNVPLETPR
ncbi:MAG TPA: bifunctional methylenetetrahydrofolate dehydrogenase/methenyltetrahydrofolate cyclohydrolase FolD [Planctomycetota bacterium]|nr:bifunctional methylenetetrahydrofolate dehydrogenase/methenyltetrahydrofolate cyclohydrolase FolD [Planctomycetota bacterium]